MAGLVDGKIALVTGAASGIGRESALLFAREGARVLVSDVDAEGGEETSRQIGDLGGQAVFHQADVCNEDQVKALVERCVSEFGGLDCAHNNAGTSGGIGLLHEIELEVWQRTLDINLTGVFLCMKHEIPVMIERGGGAIVNTASGSGIIATPGLSPYSASKHGVLGLTKTAGSGKCPDRGTNQRGTPGIDGHPHAPGRHASQSQCKENDSGESAGWAFRSPRRDCGSHGMALLGSRLVCLGRFDAG